MSDIEVMIAYLMLKVKQRDWHGVADAAMDIREMEARGKRKVFYQPAALAAAGLTHEDVVKLAMGKTDA